MKKGLKILRFIIIILLTILVSIVLTMGIINHRININDISTINIYLLLLVSIFVFFLFSFFLFKPKNVLDFIYKYRYIISLLILIIIVLGKFNGSSIGQWNNLIEPNNNINNTIIGTNREIRSDEWLVNTPFAISQKYNDYKYFNDIPRATPTDMFSTIFVPVKDIIIILRPFNIVYLLLGEEYGLSFYWYGRLIALLLVTFELMMLITNKKKLISIAGAILITGSPLVSWFYSNYIVDLLISGELCLLLFNRYLETKNNKLRVLYSILLGLTFSWFTLTIYPAWQVPLGYMYLAFAIWIFIKNYKYNRSIKDYLLLIISIIIYISILLRFYLLSKDTLDIIMNTVYPGERIITGGGSLIKHFIYPISLFFGLSDYHNPCEVSGVYSLFPVPILISIIYLIKNKKEEDKTNILVLLLVIVSILLTIFTIIKVPEILAKVTLLSMSPTERIVPIIGIICAYLIVLTVSKIDFKNNISKIIILLLTIIVSFIIIKIGSLDRTWYLTTKKLIISLMVLSLITYLYINSKRNNYYLFSILLLFIGIINIVIVNPVNIGTSVLHKKETAKEIQKLVKKDNNAKWISVNNIFLGNYIIANGGKTINSTNIYPNIEMWKKIDKEKKYNDIYNRYAHVIIELTDEENKFELVQQDTIKLYLNYNSIKDLDIKYLISSEKLNISNDYNNLIKNIYHYDNIWIYTYEK